MTTTPVEPEESVRGEPDATRARRGGGAAHGAGRVGGGPRPRRQRAVRRRRRVDVVAAGACDRGHGDAACAFTVERGRSARHRCGGHPCARHQAVARTRATRSSRSRTVGGTLFMIAAGLVIGRLADRTRRTTIIGIATLLWGAFALLTAFVTNALSYFVTRALTGIGRVEHAGRAGPDARRCVSDQRAGAGVRHARDHRDASAASSRRWRSAAW